MSQNLNNVTSISREEYWIGLSCKLKMINAISQSHSRLHHDER